MARRWPILLRAVFTFAATATVCAAENLGTVGPTYPIAEPHLLRYIEETLRAKERSGELARLEADARRRIIEAIRQPRALPGIQLVSTPRTFWVDPSITVAHTIADAAGNVIVPAGTIRNPLQVVTLSKHLLFFDGRDRDQVRRARALIDHYDGKVKPILVAGSYLELMKAWQLPVYFDQQGALTAKLGITRVPALVSQEGLRLRIDELLWSGE